MSDVWDGDAKTKSHLQDAVNIVWEDNKRRQNGELPLRAWAVRGQNDWGFKDTFYLVLGSTSFVRLGRNSDGSPDGSAAAFRRYPMDTVFNVRVGNETTDPCVSVLHLPPRADGGGSGTDAGTGAGMFGALAAGASALVERYI